MEEAILKTLAYGDIFDYPLKAWEIHKWLIGKKASLRQVEKTLKKLYQVSRIKYQGGYYFLPKRETLVRKRLERQRQSERYLFQSKFIAQLFKLIPWVKLMGISGSLAMENSTKKDDIDLFIITLKDRLWLTRILLLGVVDLLGRRRKRGDKLTKIAGKICINTLLSEDSLAQKDKNIYLAHEVLQMKVLWQRIGIYQKYLEDNSWAFKYLPNWRSGDRFKIQDLRFKRRNHQSSIINHKSFFDLLENLAKWFQLKIMGKPNGVEKISDTALYFHPEDKGPKILDLYQRKLKGLRLNPNF